MAFNGSYTKVDGTSITDPDWIAFLAGRQLNGDTVIGGTIPFFPQGMIPQILSRVAGIPVMEELGEWIDRQPLSHLIVMLPTEMQVYGFGEGVGMPTMVYSLPFPQGQGFQIPYVPNGTGTWPLTPNPMPVTPTPITPSPWNPQVPSPQQPWIQPATPGTTPWTAPWPAISGPTWTWTGTDISSSTAPLQTAGSNIDNHWHVLSNPPTGTSEAISNIIYLWEKGLSNFSPEE
jgi:hypothetical protein